MKLKPVTNDDGSPYGVRFDCPGCGEPHVVPTTGAKAWGFNGSLDAPTLAPSILVHSVRNPWGPVFDSTPTVCHSFVRDGRIEFLGDCTHALAGQTVDLPDIVTGQEPSA